MKNLLKKELKKKIYTLTTSLTSGMRSFNACSIPILRVMRSPKDTQHNGLAI